jgi:hypothetical protein
MASSRWVYKYNKTPTNNYGKVATGSNMTNGKKHIFVESMYTDKKLGINKRNGFKRK